MIASAPPSVRRLRAVATLADRLGVSDEPPAAPAPERRASRTAEPAEKATPKPEESPTTLEVAEWCRSQHIPAEIVGRWVWVKFDGKPPETVRDALKARGFRWVKARGQWAHACGVRSRRGPGDPRERYGSVPVLGDEGGAA